MGGFNDFAREAWSSSGAADLPFLNKSGVDRLFDEHRSGKADHGRMLYAIAMFSCWWKEQGPSSGHSSFPRKRESRASLEAAGPPLSRG
jgi:asparagine synthase (glutamine-hydrolysing)